MLRISFDVKGGLLIRQMHHWAALVFVGAIALHMARVFFTGAFRRPRELELGRRRCSCCCSPWPPGSPATRCPTTCCRGPGLRITQAIILAIPFVGERLTYLIFGGEWPGTDIIGRLYPVHILVIPGADHRPARRPPGAGVAPEAHPVHRARAHRAQRHRRAGVADRSR